MDADDSARELGRFLAHFLFQDALTEMENYNRNCCDQVLALNLIPDIACIVLKFLLVDIEGVEL